MVSSAEGGFVSDLNHARYRGMPELAPATPEAIFRAIESVRGG